MTPHRAPRFAELLAVWVLMVGCGPSPDDPLPPDDDLYVYSCAVADRARLRSSATNPLGLYHVGRVHQRFGLEDKALEVYHRITEAHPNFSEAYRQTGFILSQRKDRMAEAVEAYQQSIRCEPGQKGVLSRIGLVLTHMGKLDDAIRALQDEVRSETESEDTHYFLGQAHALKGEHEKAVASFRQAVLLAPKMRMAFYSLAQSLRALGRSQEADEAQRRFSELKAEEDRAAVAADAREGRKEHLLFAAETWMDAVALFASESNATKDAGQRERLQKDFLYALGEAMRLDPTLLEPRMALINHYRQRKDLESATRVYDEARRAIPNEPGLAEAAFRLAGDQVERAAADGATERLEAALGLLRQATQINPDFTDAHMELARLILFQLKEQKELLPEALEHAASCVKLDNGPRSYDILAYSYFLLGHRDRACETLAVGLRHHPGDKDLKTRHQRCIQE